uniref:Uncharacterized protein n=1 Tax=Rhizophora mucronata TaxID=61149 RepID=A0A2P2KEY3_RHIMU
MSRTVHLIEASERIKKLPKKQKNPIPYTNRQHLCLSIHRFQIPCFGS